MNINIRKGVFNFVVLDPPRTGLTEKVRDEIIQRQPAKLLYISCNPSTLSRDLKHFMDADFRLRIIQPLDLFPHTYHIENLVFLTHRYSGAQAATQAFVNLN